MSKSDAQVERAEATSMVMNTKDGTKVSAVTTPDLNAVRKGSPEESASWPAQALFLWVTRLLRIASRKRKKQKEELQFEDLFGLPEKDDTRRLYSVFMEDWQRRHESGEDISDVSVKDAEHMLWRSLFHVIRWKMLLALVVKLLNSSLQFSYPILLNFLLTYIQNPAAMPSYAGYLFAVGLGLATFFKAVCESNYFFIVQRAGWRIRSTVATAVYMKSLRLSSSARQQLSLGQIVNLMQIDSTKLEMYVTQAIFLIDGLYQIIGYVAIIYWYIGWSAFVGVGVMILAMPIQMVVMLKLTKLNRKMALRTDERVKLSNEGMQGILAVKMAAWEKKLTDAINAERGHELRYLKKTVYLSAFSSSYMMAVPAFVAVASLSVYAAVQDGEITAAILFAALSAFGQLRFPLMFYPMALASYAQATVSISRVAAYLSMSELQQGLIKDVTEPEGKPEGNSESAANGKVKSSANGYSESAGSSSAQPHESGKKTVIRVENGSFYWEKPGTKERVSYFLSKGKSKRVKGNDSDEDKEKSEGKDMDKKKEVEQETDVDLEMGQGGEAPSAILQNINFSVADKSLTAIIGPVGCGKTSLINAVLGEMFTSSGSVSISGSVALATQSAWIANDTIRNNILFGEPMDLERYKRVVEVCQLRHDLDIFEDGDQTMIGERGINLSGGQKQRISVARVAYSSKDIVILDDPLSALDPKVAQSLFDDCIADFMKDRTRVLVTNQINVLPKCDEIFVLKDAQIVEHGTYDKLMSDKGAFARLLEEYLKEEVSSDEEKDEGVVQGQAAGTNTKALNMQTSGKELIQKEERNVGAVGLKVYLGYIKNGGGYMLFAFDVFLFALSTFFLVFSSTWIALWTDDADYEQNSEAFYLVGYALLAIVLALTTYMRTALIMYIGVLASKSLHKKVLESILHAPMSFFDTTPLGRVLSRFSKDIYSVDIQVPQFFSFFLFTVVFVLFSLGTIIYTTPIFAVAVPFLLILYFWILSYYRPVARDVKRLEAISRSPVYAHFSETLGGLGTIRAFNRTEVFEKDNADKMNFNIQVWYCVKAAERWLAVRLEILGTMVTFLAAILAVVQAENGLLSAGLAGVSITFAISVTNLLGQTVRSFAELEAGMNSVERILYYSNNIPQEAPYEKEAELPKDWPTHGAITFRNLRMRYREDTPLVLKGLQFSINGGERVGVVGRTGSGKSSLFLTLMRLVEPEGQIIIDGVDISGIGLHDLRSKISIVPQNPVIFSGTLRSNLDPFGDYQDEQIEEALKQCSLWPMVEALPNGLESSISEGGENFSQGQRQLLCLARSLLRNAKILMLDEATSSVDFETDAVIQKTIRDAFKKCTILTIAHRLSTVLDNHKIVVLDNGEISEYGPPSELLKNKDGKLYEMVYALGEETAATLVANVVARS